MTVMIQDALTGEYLRRFDPEFAGGVGAAWWTDDPAQAMRFADLGEALATWKTKSAIRPLRDDGKPNRPLTAYTITFVEAPP
jgi:uncharacterized membrane protein